MAHGHCEVPGGVCADEDAVGGDSLDDALFVPHDPDNQGGSGQFVTQGGQWPQPSGKGTPITLTYSFQNMFDFQNVPGGGLRGPNAGTPPLPLGPPLPNALIRHSIEEALGLWAGVAPINYVEVPDNGLPYGDPNAKFGQIRFMHVYINGPDPVVGDPIAKAQAYFPDAGADYAGDVQFDHSDPWQEVGTLHVPDILGAATHEIGHTLGLGHTDVIGANMYWIFHRWQGLGTGMLLPDDIAGIQSIYGAGRGSVTPLPDGARQDIPILPVATGDGQFVFDNVPSGEWFGRPLESAFTYTAEAGTFFSEILKLPAGFANPFVVSVDGEEMGQFGAGESVDFRDFPGGGATNFTISDISPLPLRADPIQFPLQIAFTTSSGSFAMTAVPEPATWVMFVAMALLVAGCRRRWLH